MVESFARTLSLLRHEKKINQRTAAADFGISQALLSHYENGLREPGLEFVVKAAKYYGVTTDYLLGRSMDRDGASITVEELHDAASDKDNTHSGSFLALLHKKIIINSVSLVFELAGRTGSKKLVDEIGSYLSLAIYKVFRYLYLVGGRNPDGFFSVPNETFSCTADAEMKLCENSISCISKGHKLSAFNGEDIQSLSIPLSSEILKRDFPKHSQSILTLLQNVGIRLNKYN